MPCAWALSSHRASAFRGFHPELLARPIQSRSERYVSPGKLRRLVGVTPLTDRHGWNKNALPCTCLVNRFLVHFTTNTFVLDFELVQQKSPPPPHPRPSESTGKRNLLVHYGYRQLIIEYHISRMMKYYCLRVCKRDVRRTGKTLA